MFKVATTSYLSRFSNSLPIWNIIDRKAHIETESPRQLSDKRIIVTGATSGIGRSVALHCASQGASLILASRDINRMSLLSKQIINTNSTSVDCVYLDLSDFKSVHEFIKHIRTNYSEIDILVNNAGYLGPRQWTKDNWDNSFQVNYLSVFTLTNGIKNIIKDRIVNISSDAYELSNIDKLNKELQNVKVLHLPHYNDSITQKQYTLDDDEEPYLTYAVSKLALMLFTRAVTLNDPYLTCVSVHPGAVKSELLQNYPGIMGTILRRVVAPLFYKTPQEGATDILSALTDHRLTNGAHYISGKKVKTSKSINNASAIEIWNKTCDVLSDHNVKKLT